MNKVVISPEEVATVESGVGETTGKKRLLADVPGPLKFGLPGLIAFLPLLCLAVLGVWLYWRKREPRVRDACLRYCCGLLVISGLLSSFGVLLGAAWAFSAPAQPSFPAPPLSVSFDKARPAVGSVLSTKELAARTAGQVVIVAPAAKSGRARLEDIGFGTAVLLYAGRHDYLFATSRHVLDGMKWRDAAPFQGEAVVFDREGGASAAQIAARHKKLDLLLLRVPRSEEGEEFSQTVLGRDQLEPGERIMIFGHPEGLFFSLADGLVSRVGENDDIQITAPVSPGASGGPVFDMRGRLVGIVCAMMDKRRSPYAENLNFAVSAEGLLHPEDWEGDASSLELLRDFARRGVSSTQSTTDEP